MSNYTKLTDFAVKDTLPTGNAAKIVKGEEIDDEFNWNWKYYYSDWQRNCW